MLTKQQLNKVQECRIGILNILKLMDKRHFYMEYKVKDHNYRIELYSNKLEILEFNKDNVIWSNSLDNNLVARYEFDDIILIDFIKSYNKIIKQIYKSTGSK
jgi:hypothetical protein